MIAQALELFIEDVTKLAANLAIRNGDNKVTPSHLKTVVLDHSGDPSATLVTFPFKPNQSIKEPL
jgi:hypothetical protein